MEFILPLRSVPDVPLARSNTDTQQHWRLAPRNPAPRYVYVPLSVGAKRVVYHSVPVVAGSRATGTQQLSSYLGGITCIRRANNLPCACTLDNFHSNLCEGDVVVMDNPNIIVNLIIICWLLKNIFMRCRMLKNLMYTGNLFPL